MYSNRCYLLSTQYRPLRIFATRSQILNGTLTTHTLSCIILVITHHCRDSTGTNIWVFKIVTFELLNATGCFLACEIYILIPSLWRNCMNETSLIFQTRSNTIKLFCSDSQGWPWKSYTCVQSTQYVITLCSTEECNK